jgi:TRAP-type mannitol/chloroaromatic compound transport system permease large subunit
MWIRGVVKMHYFKFLFYEFILFSLLVILNYYLDGYLIPPFTKVDLIAGIISLSIFAIFFTLLGKLYKRFYTILLRNKILLSIPTFIIAGLITGIIMSHVFGVE